MKKQIDAAIHAAENAKKEIEEIRNRIAPSDPNGKKKYIDEAEMGAEWVIRRLQELKNLTANP